MLPGLMEVKHFSKMKVLIASFKIFKANSHRKFLDFEWDSRVKELKKFVDLQFKVPRN